MTSIELLAEPLLHFVRLTDRVHYVYIYSAFVIATLLYFLTRRERKTIGNWLHFCFPREIYLHKSAKLDYLYFLVNSILFAALIAPAAFQLFSITGTAITDLFITLGGPSSYRSPSLWTPILFTVLTTLAFDFGTFYSHYLHHKIPFLWQFHKVHHTAEVLTPITVYRMHPLDDLITMLLSATLSALVFATFNYLYPGQIAPIQAFGLNILLFAFYLLGYNLRHSHIWLSYGRFASHLLISPAQHQIHHSCKPEHIDKNFGLIFALWDWLFKTLYIPSHHEQLVLGINDDQEKFQTVSNLYLQPFRWGFKHKPTLTVIVVLTLFLMAVWSLKLLLLETQPDPELPVTLEDLTYSEVQTLINDGYTTAIIPTGGTEQNGPHVILGKHNYIVRYTSEAVARRLGQTLVAPVIAYVPEGNIDPPTGHMTFAGTISMPEEIFSATLEYSARSLKQHGFKLICFMGDSGWNQPAQQAIAEKLSNDWRNESVTVLSVDSYYFNNQVHELKSQGFSENQIGQHAGIRDTSELLRVHPTGVRTTFFSQENPTAPGVDGHYWLATPDIGERMLRIKIDAAVQQIQKYQTIKK